MADNWSIYLEYIVPWNVCRRKNGTSFEQKGNKPAKKRMYYVKIIIRTVPLSILMTRTRN